MEQFWRKIKSIFIAEADTQYWDQRATNLDYLVKRHTGEVLFDNTTGHLSLDERAKVAVGIVDFEAMLVDLEITTDYRSLNQNDVVVAVCIGIMGVGAAQLTNHYADALEEKFLKLHKYFKPKDTGASPLDYRAGGNHRAYFGHDFNLMQKLPDDYTFNGQNVGGQTVYSLVLKYLESNFPGSSGLGLHLKAILHIITHYLSDLPTTKGLPLPFSSFFTEWRENPVTSSGYSASNPLMDTLGDEYGTINAADVSTYAVMKVLLLSYGAYAHRGLQTPADEKVLHKTQLAIIAYGTALVIQMLLLVSGTLGRTGKLNYLIAGPFLWNSTRSVLIVHKQHRHVMSHYRKSIAVLNDSESNFDDWINEICQ
ncbi:hypothetical protein PGS49_22675 [Yersinia intermedia]|uniref:hypothetical protein n=1 Tax=Yersinia intermedia TaxID=631 RepID=UPI00119F94C3|nr:hypothetical protein [Yersinia intermedia]MDA5483406.1 hypothetical protein [Yersinia intermedia]